MVCEVSLLERSNGFLLNQQHVDNIVVTVLRVFSRSENKKIEFGCTKKVEGRAQGEKISKKEQGVTPRVLITTHRSGATDRTDHAPLNAVSGHCMSKAENVFLDFGILDS